MDEKIMKRYQLRADIFKALAHPLRIYMLDMLAKQKWCVSGIAGELGVDKSIASKHLAQLKAAGLLDDKKYGTMVEYRLAVPQIKDMLAGVEKTVAHRRKRLAISAPEPKPKTRSKPRTKK